MTVTTPFPVSRLRRLRRGTTLRTMLRETTLQITDLIQPLFIKAGITSPQPITSMPGCVQLPINLVAREAHGLRELGIPAVLLFGIPDTKDDVGSRAWQEDGIVQQAIREIKTATPDLVVIADCCFCEYTTHGHCGVLSSDVTEMTVDNDATLANLAIQAVSLAQAGADIIAPSGMQDGMVSSIRSALDTAGFSHIAIMSYAVKYASSCYGPFREAAEGAPQFGDRKHYQMDPANRYEAWREADRDIQEAADLLIIKPAMLYLDIIRDLANRYPEVPLVAYQVSGEYAMIKAASQLGWLEHDAVMLESLLAIKRAGARQIISYFAKDAAIALSERR